MDSDDDISEGEILSDDGELTNNADDDYEDGMLLDDDEEGETDTEDSNQSDVTEVGDCEATENHVSHNSRSDWKHNRKRQYTKGINSCLYMMIIAVFNVVSGTNLCNTITESIIFACRFDLVSDIGAERFGYNYCIAKPFFSDTSNGNNCIFLMELFFFPDVLIFILFSIQPFY